MANLKSILRHKIAPQIMKVVSLNIENYYKLWYIFTRRRMPNLKNPNDFSEIMLSRMTKLEWEKHSVYVDKVAVRDYVVAKGLGNILTKSYGVFKNANDIDFDKLPNQFALKTNNGCGKHIFCSNKDSLDVSSTVKLLNDTLRAKYNNRYEPQYRNIQPKILAEELLADGTGVCPTDYKIQCFNGKPHHVFVGTERDSHVRYSTFDFDWNVLNYIKGDYLPSRLPAKPKQLALMRSIAEKLSEDFEFVRVDLYDLGDRVVFGELTFSPGAGIAEFYTDEAVMIMGDFFYNGDNIG